MFVSNEKSVNKASDNRVPIPLLSWSSHVKSWDSSGVVRIMRYEDLVENPIQWFTEILLRYGVKPDAEKVRASVSAAKMENLSRQEEENGFVERYNDGTFFGGTKDWREALPRGLARKIREDHAEIMEQLGYGD